MWQCKPRVHAGLAHRYHSRCSRAGFWGHPHVQHDGAGMRRLQRKPCLLLACMRGAWCVDGHASGYRRRGCGIFSSPCDRLVCAPTPAQNPWALANYEPPMVTSLTCEIIIRCWPARVLPAEPVRPCLWGHPVYADCCPGRVSNSRVWLHSGLLAGVAALSSRSESLPSSCCCALLPSCCIPDPSARTRAPSTRLRDSLTLEASCSSSCATPPCPRSRVRLANPSSTSPQGHLTLPYVVGCDDVTCFFSGRRW